MSSFRPRMFSWFSLYYVSPRSSSGYFKRVLSKYDETSLSNEGWFSYREWKGVLAWLFSDRHAHVGQVWLSACQG